MSIGTSAPALHLSTQHEHYSHEYKAGFRSPKQARSRPPKRNSSTVKRFASRWKRKGGWLRLLTLSSSPCC
ncbi:Heat shock protein 78 [Fusarium oxysporum f. sp. albedinis]|nr:Heat shock protein 78 [Fusarium oxysporum f. sp. albedinis]